MKDYSISGSGKLPGCDDYGKISVSGSGRIGGSIRCEALSVSGSCHVEGDTVCAGRFDISGSCRTDGGVRTETLSVSGSCRLGGAAEAKTIDVSGALHAEGNLRAGTLSGGGALHTPAGVEADSVVFTGKLEIGGLLNAEKIDLRLCGASNVHDLGGTEITVRSGPASADRTGGVLSTISASLSSLFGGPSGRLSADVIEGDTLNLDAVDARVVRGRKIFLHAGCRIERVEYAESLDVEEGASVGERIPT